MKLPWLSCGEVKVPASTVEPPCLNGEVLNNPLNCEAVMLLCFKYEVVKIYMSQLWSCEDPLRQMWHC